MATTKAKKFPTYIYVTRENQDTEDEFFNVFQESAAEALDSTEPTYVATYELVEVKVGNLQPVFG